MDLKKARNLMRHTDTIGVLKLGSSLLKEVLRNGHTDTIGVLKLLMSRTFGFLILSHTDTIGVLKHKDTR